MSTATDAIPHDATDEERERIPAALDELEEALNEEVEAAGRAANLELELEELGVKDPRRHIGGNFA